MSVIDYQDPNLVLNCDEKNFGGHLKMGDMIAMLNIFAHQRKINNNPNIKFYLPESAIYGNKEEHYRYIRQFKSLLELYTDFFSNVPSTHDLKGEWEIWSFRELQGEHILLPNTVSLEKKICVFPLLDAKYNEQRNWPSHVLNAILEEFSSSEYYDYEKIIGINNKDFLSKYDLKQFKVSTNFLDNIKHILSCSYYLGGDTGLSHFASIFDADRTLRYYYYNGLHGTWRSEFTAPFNLSKGKGKLFFYEKQTMSIIKKLSVYDVFSTKTRLGRKGDGGYIINEKIIQNSNILVSLGFDNEYSFDKDWNTITNKKVIVADGSCDCGNLCIDLSDSVEYRKEHIKSSEQLDDILNPLSNVLLKIDIEGDEYEVLKTADLTNVVGINIEFHRLNDLRMRNELISLLRGSLSSFLIYHIHGNSHGDVFELLDNNTKVLFPETLEISFINKNFVDNFQLDLETKFPITGLDYSNHPQKNDHSLPWINTSRGKSNSKVSFVCTTYRRFTCVNRIIAQYYAQTYSNKELIIFNTDMEYPLVLGFEDPSITVINNNLDYVTGNPYENRGQICRDAVTHATGDYFMLADDDDIYLPWHLQQAIDEIHELGTDAWKPEQSFFAQPNRLILTSNTMEASVIVKMDRIREFGFRSDLTGYEGLSWYTKLRDEGQLDEHNKYYVPSYCFNWSDPHEISGHKQSGDINNPNNFENHKQNSLDYAHSPLTNTFDLEQNKTYDKFFQYYREHYTDFPEDLMKKYVNKYLV